MEKSIHWVQSSMSSPKLNSFFTACLQHAKLFNSYLGLKSKTTKLNCFAVKRGNLTWALTDPKALSYDSVVPDAMPYVATKFPCVIIFVDAHGNAYLTVCCALFRRFLTKIRWQSQTDAPSFSTQI